MTNEELCMFIKNDDDGYLPQLWEQTRKFIVLKAKKYYCKFENHYGIEVDDLVQSGYFAILRTVEYYSPEKGFKFITLLNHTLKAAFSRTMGLCSTKRDILNYARSLDEPIYEEGDITLLDRIGDLTPDGGDVQTEVIESVYHQELHRALDSAMSILSDDKRSILELHYYFGLSYEQLGKKRGVSRSFIESKAYDARMRIYNSSHRAKREPFLYLDDDNLYRGTGYLAWKHSGASAAENKILREEKRDEQRDNQSSG